MVKLVSLCFVSLVGVMADGISRQMLLHLSPMSHQLAPYGVKPLKGSW